MGVIASALRFFFAMATAPSTTTHFFFLSVSCQPIDNHDATTTPSRKVLIMSPNTRATKCINKKNQVRIQLMGSMSPDTKKPSFPALLSHMVKTEGISSIYAGLSAALMRQAIYGTARIGLHRTFSDKLQEVR